MYGKPFTMIEGPADAQMEDLHERIARLNQPPQIDATLPCCPFCGSHAEVQYWHGGGLDKRLIACSEDAGECLVRPMVCGETLAEARENWSRRAPATS